MCVHQWFWHCAWKVNNTRLTKRLHFLQKCGLFPRMLYFLFSILEKKKCLYTMILMPAMNSALYCCTYYYLIYVYIYTLFDKFIGFFTIVYVSRKMYLIFNRHECNFQLQILNFLKSVLHPFMLPMSAFQ